MLAALLIKSTELKKTIKVESYEIECKFDLKKEKKRDMVKLILGIDNTYGMLM